MLNKTILVFQSRKTVNSEYIPCLVDKSEIDFRLMFETGNISTFIYYTLWSLRVSCRFSPLFSVWIHS